MKRLFALLIACVLLIGMLPLGVMAAGETVYRVFGANRYATSTLIADKLKEDAGVDRFGSVIVASGANFPDALAGSYLAAVTGVPIILVNKGTVDMDWFSANVAAGANVYILGGEAAVSGKAENQLQGYAVERLAGSNRYETNLIILRKAMELGGSTRDILVCTGGNFADSLSASATGKAILLVNKSLNEEQKAFLASAGCENIYVLGGTAAVSEKIQSSLTSYGPVTRISGNTRYETSVKIAETFFPGATNAVVAYAKNFPDGLCGGPLAICMGSPLILTNTGSEAMAAAYANQAGIHAGIVLGGEGLISDSAAKKIFGAGEIATYQKDATPVCSHDYMDATCTVPRTCRLCGVTEGSAAGHSWSDATCTEPKTCTVCGAAEGSAAAHSWKVATCTAPKTCEICGATEGSAVGHSWNDATCSTPKTCAVCGAADGSASGHVWKDATCTEPKTCTVCGSTEGSANGHSYSKAVTAPTCIAQGYTTYTCTCGDSYVGDYTTAGHSYVKYKCVNCGAVDKAHAYEYLIEWVKLNGIANGSHVDFDHWVTSEVYKKYTLSYNATSKTLYVCCSEDVDGTFFYYALYLDSYFYGCSLGNEDPWEVVGYIDPAEFTSNSPIDYEQYTGPSDYKWDMIELTRLCIVDLVDWLDWMLYTYDVGITIQDLGFTAY